MKKIAVILAGGEGHRAGGDIPKQFRNVGGHPIYQWSLMAFHDEDPGTRIILVCHPGAFDLLDILEEERAALPENDPFREKIFYELICGGRSRRESVMNALMEIDSDKHTLVAVHDSARPLASSAMIARGWETAAAKGSAVPVVPVTDSLRVLDADGTSAAVDRSRFRAVQTPQVFRADIIKESYAGPDDASFTDDASIVQAAGFPIALYDGEPDNMKVTMPSDFLIADTLLSSRF